MKSGDENARAIGEKVTENIVDDIFSDEVEKLLAITKPSFLMIRFDDGEELKMGDICEKIDCMIGEIRDIMQIISMLAAIPEWSKSWQLDGKK